MRRFTVSIVLTLQLLALAAPAAAEVDGAVSMREGNSLARQGLYRAALVRYEEARAAGLDTALLHYNLGVVHYKLGQYDEAQRAFERAADDSALGAVAAYNLGLTLRDAGRTDQAERRFTQAAARSNSRELRALAERAAQSLDRRPAERRGAQPTAAPPRRLVDARIGELSVALTAGYGQVDNANRSPSGPYVDIAQPGLPVVTPVSIASAYVPLDLRAQYVLRNEAGDTDFVFRYRLDGNFYDDELANDESSQRLDIGAHMVLGENRRRTLRPSFFVTRHREADFDPDDGLDREINGVDVSTRFNYSSAGAEAEYEHVLGKWRWGLDMRFELREYDSVPLVSDHDHEFLFGRLSMAYDLNEATSLTFGLRRYREEYAHRRAYDLAGNLFATNPELRYDFSGYQLGMTRRITRAFELGLDYMSIDRTDAFLGYNDYGQRVLRLKGDFRPGPRLHATVAALSRTYDYSNAFAFNAPSAGPRELDALSSELRVEFRITRRITLCAEVEIRDVTSTDLRAEYGQTRTMFGASWRY